MNFEFWNFWKLIYAKGFETKNLSKFVVFDMRWVLPIWGIEPLTSRSNRLRLFDRDQTRCIKKIAHKVIIFYSNWSSHCSGFINHILIYSVEYINHSCKLWIFNQGLTVQIVQLINIENAQFQIVSCSKCGRSIVIIVILIWKKIKSSTFGAWYYKIPENLFQTTK
jgi:hypothetical protein